MFGSCTHFILLRKLEVVVGFQALQVVGQFCHGDGRVAGHACQSEGQQVSQQAPPRREPRPSRGHSQSLEKQPMCWRAGMEEWALVRLAGSLKAAAMLGERRWTQKPMRSRRRRRSRYGEKRCYWHARWAVSAMGSAGTSHIEGGNVRPGGDIRFER